MVMRTEELIALLLLVAMVSITGCLEQEEKTIEHPTREEYFCSDGTVVSDLSLCQSIPETEENASKTGNPKPDIKTDAEWIFGDSIRDQLKSKRGLGVLFVNEGGKDCIGCTCLSFGGLQKDVFYTVVCTNVPAGGEAVKELPLEVVNKMYNERYGRNFTSVSGREMGASPYACGEEEVHKMPKGDPEWIEGDREDWEFSTSIMFEAWMEDSVTGNYTLKTSS